MALPAKVIRAEARKLGEGVAEGRVGPDVAVPQLCAYIEELAAALEEAEQEQARYFIRMRQEIVNAKVSVLAEVRKLLDAKRGRSARRDPPPPPSTA
jgi:uncharacterized protein (DUF885 family)